MKTKDEIAFESFLNEVENRHKTSGRSKWNYGDKVSKGDGEEYIFIAPYHTYNNAYKYVCGHGEKIPKTGKVYKNLHYRLRNVKTGKYVSANSIFRI